MCFTHSCRCKVWKNKIIFFHSLTILQIVQEAIQIPGSGLHLTYQSSQASGYLSIVRMRLTTEIIPDTLTHVHVGVEIEGSLHVKTYEADPNLTHIFAWNKRNVYKQKVYGVSIARISVGYQHSTCKVPVWETQTAKLQGFDVDISDVGGWGLGKETFRLNRKIRFLIFNRNI